MNGMQPVHGMKEAQQFLRQLDDKVSRRLLLSALRRASRPLVRAGKAQAPVADRAMKEFWGSQLQIAPGTLKHSIGTITPKRKNEKLAEMYVGPKKLKSSMRSKRIKSGKMLVNKNDAWFRHFVIRGTAGYTIKNGKNKGKYMPGQAANPFMDRARSQSGPMVTNELEKSLVTSINSYVKRKQK